jgi:hypothetical protein
MKYEKKIHFDKNGKPLCNMNTGYGFIVSKYWYKVTCRRCKNARTSMD